jgi:phage shock protein E
MFDFIKKLFGGSSVNYGELIENGAVIIDVRTAQEYRSGHVQGSVNIPLDALKGSIKKIKKDSPVIVCCASGMRSGAAKSVLIGSGFKEVYNAGSWTKLRKYVA